MPPEPPRARRLDINPSPDGGPAIHLWDHNGNRHHYPLTPHEACAIIRRLTGYIAVLHRPDHDRTQESRDANPELHEDTA